ncbi:hypothetical protein BH23CHL7_BH23CHL7_02900 [soil metagenome]
MSSRLQLKYGLVAEQDRLSSSADALIVTEPTTGSKARTKGSLYVIVTAGTPSSRARDACKMVADLIRREYYYDESAGIAIVLEKAVRAANRRLRHAREGSGLAPGSLGIALAVVRGNELYVASAGGAEAYLVRAARLLMPEHDPGEGLPRDDALRVDVWRGEFSVGDSLVLCSRNLVEAVGTEELKNAVVTLHPQSAVEHLHHLFVAAGGEGSDAVLAIEASEVALSRVEHRLVPVNPSEPLAGAPARSPIPLADQFAGAASAMQDRASAARSVIRESVANAVGSLLDLMPQRRTAYRRITPVAQRRETQRRSATALLVFIAVVGVLGTGLWLWGGPLRGTENPPTEISTGEQAFLAARARIDQVYDGNMLVNDRNRARDLLRQAWSDLDRAEEAGVTAGQVAPLRGRAADGLDAVYGIRLASATLVANLPEGSEVTSLVRGPDDAAYVIASRQVARIDLTTGSVVAVAQAGDGPGTGMGAPILLSRGGPDLLILDVRGGLYRWRPSTDAGQGTLGSLTVGGDLGWGPDVPDIGTFVVNPDLGHYRLYVPHAETSQILRYEPVGDGSGFSPPVPYFLGEDEPVASFRQLLIDGDIYALTGDGVLKYFSGRSVTYSLAAPPDDEDVRPGHQYRYLAASGGRGFGQLVLWDAQHARMVVFGKSDGRYVAQWIGRPGEPGFDDVRGMYVIDRGDAEPSILVWATPRSIYQAVLEPADEPLPTGSPSPGTTPAGSPTPGVSPGASPTGPAGLPTERPRRTPRP